MKTELILSALVLAFVSCGKTDSVKDDSEPGFELPEKAIVLAEQASTSVMIMNAETNIKVWQWTPSSASFTEEQLSWFENPSEVKPVYDGECVLMTASGGAVALIRVSDSKVLFYGKCGEFPNPHSAEILPDGNILAVESRYGQICIFVRDEDEITAGHILAATVPDAHNAVWDKTKARLYVSGKAENGKLSIYSFEYNYDRLHPALTNQKEIYGFSDETGGHDLYPVYGEENMLWLTAANGVYKLDVSDLSEVKCEKVYNMLSIKSISNSEDGVIMLKPRESWWSDRLIDGSGQAVFFVPDTKIYKARWWLANTFSY